MAFETSIVRTHRYGLVGVTVNPVDEDDEPGVGTTEQLSGYDFSDNSDKTWGLSTKFYVLSSIDNHNKDPDAHRDAFNDILSKYADIVKDGRDMKFFKISDTEGNVIYANGMVSHDEGETKNFLVTSAKRTDFDADVGSLSERMDEIERILDGKQDRILAAGLNVTIDPETNTISAKDTVYTLPDATSAKIGGVYLDDTVKHGGRNPVTGGAVKTAIDTVVNSVKPLPSPPVSEGATTKVSLSDGNDTVLTPGPYTNTIKITLEHGDGEPMEASMLVLHNDIQAGRPVVLEIQGHAAPLFCSECEKPLEITGAGTGGATRLRFTCIGDGGLLVDRTDYAS